MLYFPACSKISCYDKFLCFQLDADSPGVQSTSSYQSASTEEEVLTKTHFQIVHLLTIMLDPQPHEHCSPGGGGHPLPGASGHLPSWDSRRGRGQPVLKKLLRASPSNLPHKPFVENLVRFLSLCFLSVVISVNHLKTNLFQSLQFTYSHRKSFSNFLMWLWIFKWRKRSFVFAQNVPNL